MAGRITAAMERGRTRKIARRVLVSSAIFRYHPFFRHVLFFGLLPSVRSFVRSFVRSLARSLVRSFVRSFVGRAFSRRFFDTVPNRKRFSIRTWLAGDVATRRGAAAGDRLSLSGLDFDSRGQRTPARFYRIQSFALKGTRTSHLSPG